MKLFYVVLLVLALLFVVPVTFAQGIDPDAIPTPDSVVLQMLQLIATFGVGVAVLAEPLISLYKAVTNRWFPNAANYTEIVAFLVPVILVVLYWGADFLGYASQYEVVANNLVTIIPVVLTMFSGLLGTSAAYQVARKIDAPVVGKDKIHFTKKTTIEVPAAA